MNCPRCQSITVETYELLYPASSETPEEYTEYNVCIACNWNDRDVLSEQEIPF